MTPGQSKSGEPESQSETVVIRSLGNAPQTAGDDYERPRGAVPLEATTVPALHVEAPAEHIRNALAILSALEWLATHSAYGLVGSSEVTAAVTGATKRLNAALEQLEPRGERR